MLHSRHHIFTQKVLRASPGSRLTTFLHFYFLFFLSVRATKTPPREATFYSFRLLASHRGTPRLFSPGLTSPRLTRTAPPHKT
ncbi:hypothetical protein E2C01_011397 [Portunus trituberculatus]|uniref:Uncharacterized protein n=1 Tax=Portunus trituberculatus TaxID=210409 RepID=A0A5B7DB37_PORTR|nr:hypothetical protein [Portunus trituberculatus]